MATKIDVGTLEVFEEILQGILFIGIFVAQTASQKPGQGQSGWVGRHNFEAFT